MPYRSGRNISPSTCCGLIAGSESVYLGWHQVIAVSISLTTIKIGSEIIQRCLLAEPPEFIVIVWVVTALTIAGLSEWIGPAYTMTLGLVSYAIYGPIAELLLSVPHTPWEVVGATLSLGFGQMTLRCVCGAIAAAYSDVAHNGRSVGTLNITRWIVGILVTAMLLAQRGPDYVYEGECATSSFERDVAFWVIVGLSVSAVLTALFSLQYPSGILQEDGTRVEYIRHVRKSLFASARRTIWLPCQSQLYQSTIPLIFVSSSIKDTYLPLMDRFSDPPMRSRTSVKLAQYSALLMATCVAMVLVSGIKKPTSVETSATSPKPSGSQTWAGIFHSTQNSEIPRSAYWSVNELHISLEAALTKQLLFIIVMAIGVGFIGFATHVMVNYHNSVVNEVLIAITSAMASALHIAMAFCGHWIIAQLGGNRFQVCVHLLGMSQFCAVLGSFTFSLPGKILPRTSATSHAVLAAHLIGVLLAVICLFRSIRRGAFQRIDPVAGTTEFDRLYQEAASIRNQAVIDAIEMQYAASHWSKGIPPLPRRVSILPSHSVVAVSESGKQDERKQAFSHNGGCTNHEADPTISEQLGGCSRLKCHSVFVRFCKRRLERIEDYIQEPKTLPPSTAAVPASGNTSSPTLRMLQSRELLFMPAPQPVASMTAAKESFFAQRHSPLDRSATRSMTPTPRVLSETSERWAAVGRIVSMVVPSNGGPPFSEGNERPPLEGSILSDGRGSEDEARKHGEDISVVSSDGLRSPREAALLRRSTFRRSVLHNLPWPKLSVVIASGSSHIEDEDSSTSSEAVQESQDDASSSTPQSIEELRRAMPSLQKWFGKYMPTYFV